MTTLLGPSIDGKIARHPCSKVARAHMVIGGFRSCAFGVRLREHDLAGHFCPGCRLGGGHIVWIM